MNKSVSPSRTYVAVCNKSNFDGYYFRKFHLPESYKHEYFVPALGMQVEQVPLENNSDVASWYFLNHLNFVACIDGVITWEDYSGIEDEPTREEKDARYKKAFEEGQEDSRREKLLQYHKDRISQFTNQAVEATLRYVERESHEPGCDGNFNGGESCSCSPYNEED